MNSFVEKVINYKLPQSYLDYISGKGREDCECFEFVYYDEFFGRERFSGGEILTLPAPNDDDLLDTFILQPDLFLEGFLAFAKTNESGYICFDYRQEWKTKDPAIVYRSAKEIVSLGKNFEEFLASCQDVHFEWVEKTEIDGIEFVEKIAEISIPYSYGDFIKICDPSVPIKVRLQNLEAIFLSLKQCQYTNLLDVFLSQPEFFPQNLIAFADTGGGDFICFDYRQDQLSNNPPVVLWQHEADEGEVVSFVAHNFEEFLSILKEPTD
jgi:SMI1 / KNR4 family (SUKH-1)